MTDEIRTRRRAARAVAAAALLWTASAHAHPPPPDGSPAALAEPPDALHFQPLRDGILTGLGVAFWIVEETAFKDELAPDECRWCDRDGAGNSSLNGLDASMRDLVLWDDRGAADAASNVSAYVVAPLVSLGMGALAAGREGRLP